jgi:hypothetical protein
VFCPVCIQNHPCTWLGISLFDSKHLYNFIILHNVLLVTCSVSYLLFLCVDLWNVKYNTIQYNTIQIRKSAETSHNPLRIVPCMYLAQDHHYKQPNSVRAFPLVTSNYSQIAITVRRHTIHNKTAM